jgi:hypothetical protein
MRASHGVACEGRPRIDSERAKDRATGCDACIARGGLRGTPPDRQ